ncbi:MAG: YchJ family metal-binding protein [Desulfuromonadales bacterium]|nr:YchJ family metal-binding protein [Desulfuromonadales bacterium]
MTPSELILARCQAFKDADYGLIYDSYHSQSNFMRQFPARDEYLAYARSSLGPDFSIRQCKILAEDVGADEARVLLLMEMTAHGAALIFVELAWLKVEAGCWKYHRGHKMTEDDLPSDPESVRFDDFAKLDPGTIF